MIQSESIETRRKRVLYRANHRGTQEMDILIGGFVADGIEGFDEGMLDRIEKLMDQEETDLQAWILGQRGIPYTVDQALIAAIRDHKLAKAGA
ncbi:succinate dehydrogenase assembly factor 2 [Pelagibacterium limicola]|uniref:succinate dehydrogenase assembly factor 2 n=1 Tax=Pelagibacterium limicola TaxID=2791022 RepID=UPI0018AF9381|nr:succinate dehydrogenase assembly factor 2 [Pelagibacterium limicola]